MNKKIQFNEAASAWDEEEKHIRMAKTIANAIIKSLPLAKKMHLLDYGCGTGLVTMLLQPLVQSITAVDISDSMLSVLQEKIKRFKIPNVRTRQLDSETDKLGTDSYDAIISTMTVHHVLDYGKLLQCFYSLLNLRGRLCIVDLVSEDGNFHSDNSTVEHFGFAESEIKQSFADCGFKEIEYRIIHTEIKTVYSGQEKVFPFFLISGVRPAL